MQDSSLQLKRWFILYHEELLFLANHPIGKKLLNIQDSDQRKIFKLSPNSYHKFNIDGTMEATFFTSNFVAERLLDYLTTPKQSNPNFIQRLQFAYNTSTFNPATGERMGRKSNVGTWAGARGAASSDGDSATCEVSSQLNGGTYYNYRLFQPFDTSALGVGATVTAANWQAYRDDVQEIGSNGENDADGTTLEIVVSTEADPTAYTATDYANVSFTSKGSLAFASVGSNNTYTNGGNGISITDLSIINVTGYTKLAIITGRDLNNSAPTGLNSQTFQNRSQANPPKLVVTYTPATTTSTSTSTSTTTTSTSTTTTTSTSSSTSTSTTTTSTSTTTTSTSTTTTSTSTTTTSTSSSTTTSSSTSTTTTLPDLVFVVEHTTETIDQPSFTVDHADFQA